MPDVSNFLKELLQWAMDSATTDVQARAAFQTIASIANKHPEGVFSNVKMSVGIFDADHSCQNPPTSSASKFQSFGQISPN